MRVSIPSYAKVNLGLKVLGKRGDGYHEIRSIMTQVSLWDELEIELRGDGIELTSTGEPAPQGPENLAYKAAEAFFKETGRPWGAAMRIKKRIPQASGLGGGSSNAAATLLALNRLLGHPLDEGRLMEMGAALGADVPFFIFGGPAKVGGKGERLSPVREMPRLWFLLAIPPFPVETSRVYGALNLQLTKKEDGISITNFGDRIDCLLPLLKNDLEPVVAAWHPEIGEMRRCLLSLGAVAALMTGSGGTMMGIFDQPIRAAEAAFMLNKAPGRRSYKVHNI